MPTVAAVIPARLGSTRFPNKVIYPLQGKPLLYYLVRSLEKSRQINRLIVATDSREIVKAMQDVDVEVMMTSKRHRTGTDRVAEIATKVKSDIYLNIQADNMGLKAAELDRVIARFISERKEAFGTTVARVENDEELANPNCVKVVVSKDGYARWFSRLPLPYIQKPDSVPLSEQFKFHKHIGIYIFRKNAIRQFADWGRSASEKAESLEQLRILENGGSIRAYETKMKTVSVDSPEDIDKTAAILVRK